MAEQTYEPVNQTLFDPWLKLREKTAHFNEVRAIADRYSKMRRLAAEQFAELKDKPKVKQETLSALLGIIQFCGDKAEPLWQSVAKLEAELHEETERLNAEA